MRRTHPKVAALFAASAIIAGSSLQSAIDPSNPANYANQAKPAYIQRDNTPPENAITDVGATLGRVLFYDRKLSINDTVSCATCHRQDHAFSDPSRASTGVNGNTGRHSMRLINTRFAVERRMFWDERALSVEDQATQPIQDHAEMGFSGQNGDPSLDDLIDKMNNIPYYPYLFNAAFGTPQIDEDRIQRAIAQFVRSIQSFDSKYDAGRAQQPNDNAPFPNFTASENRGKALFLPPAQFNQQGLRIGGGVGCGGCHRPPEFDIDPQSRSNGVIGSIGGGMDLTNTRSPTLRNLVDPQGNPQGPFMHDGSLTTLRSVIDHYNVIPAAAAAPDTRPAIDQRLLPGGNLQRLQLTETEKGDIESFLGTLSGSSVYTDARWSDPFEPNGELIVIGLEQTPTVWMIY